jgi:cell division protein FtsW
MIKRINIPDIFFFSLVLLLAAFGLIMVFSASSVVAMDRYGDALFYLKRQLTFLLGGFFTLWILVETDYRRWISWGGWILGGAFLMLMLVYVPGVGMRVGGALRWVSFGGFRLQPAEFAKLALVVYMSWALARKGDNIRSLYYGLLPMLGISAALAFLMLKQPDFGNAVLLMLLAITMVFLAGGRVGYLFGVLMLAAPVAISLIMGADYRKRRLLAFLNPWEDPQNTSYQIVQSFTAFYSGGLWGRGLGNSQEKLHYLPEVHTDFIAAIVGEELGFIGVALLILTFFVLIMRGFQIALHARDRSGFLLAAGCTSMLGYQFVLNFAVVMGLLPTKGLPMPLLSHGGSALISTLMACGLILSVARYSNAPDGRV